MNAAMNNAETPESILRQMLDQYFSAFARGDDVPPARRYFLEGYLRACVDGELLNLAQAGALIGECCQPHLGDELARQYSTANTLILHSHMKRAPVYPTC